MKYTKQHDERDCGAVCLSMIASYYGLNYNISKYRELTKTDRNGTSLYGIVDGAEKIGFYAKSLSGNIEELLDSISKKEISFPFIAHTLNEDGMLHFVVVFNIKEDYLIVGDPGKGKCKLSIKDFSDQWSGYIVTFEKTQEFKKGNYTKGKFTKFFSLLKGQKKLLIGVIFLSFIISAISISGAYVFETVLNNFGSTSTHSFETTVHAHENILDAIVCFVSKNANQFQAIFIVLIILYLIQGFTEFARGYLLSLMAKNTDIKLMLSYYNHILDLPMATISTRNTGEYLSRFSDASAIRDAVSGATLTLILDSVMAIACGFFLFNENRLLFLVSFIMVILYACAVFLYKKPLEYAKRNIMEDNARVESFLKESIDGIATVKANQAEITTKAKNGNKFFRLMQSVFHGNILDASLSSICNVIELVGTVIILWIGFTMAQSSVISVGSLISFYALLGYFSSPIKNVINLQPTIQTAVVAADRLNDILDVESENISREGTKELQISSVDFENVDFRYGNHELAIKSLSLHIEKGEKIAIVGESGSGKTTLAKLLMKFYEPENGRISINGTDLKDCNSALIRNCVAYVNQETFLFSDTVKNNLLLSDPGAADEEIKQACISANVYDFITELPFGFNTYLDENGQNLSGGQRQRLSIARALLKKPQLLVLDEATSNLDSITENRIKNTIFERNKNLTCIIIAHRLNTIKNCDKIVVMDSGTIAEIGSHDELMAKKGKYYTYFLNT